MGETEADDRITWPLIRAGLITCFGSILTHLSTTTVNVALDTLIVELDSTLTQIQWVTTGYLLTLTLILPLTRWAASRVGMKRLYVSCLAGFMLTSLLCGLAWSAESLIAFRMLQGATGGLLAPILQSMIGQLAGPRRVGRLMALVGAPVLLSPLLGPVVGGAMVQYLNWRWLFAFNVPIALLGIALAWRYLPRDEKPVPLRFDALGLLLISPGMALATFAVSEFGHAGTLAAPLVAWPLVGGVVLTALFAGHALRKGEAALLDLRLLLNPLFTAATLIQFIAAIASFGGQLLLPLYFLQAGGYSPAMVGLLLIPQSLGTFIALPFTGRYTDRGSPALVCLVGILCFLAGTAPFMFLAEAPPYWLLGLGQFFRGLGIAATGSAAMVIAYRDMPREAMPNASTVQNMIQRFGAPVGTALMAVMLQYRTAAEIAEGATQAVALTGAFAQTFALNFALILPLFACVWVMARRQGKR